jgi:hypothetical protein
MKDKQTVIIYSALIVVGEERLGGEKKDVRKGEN